MGLQWGDFLFGFGVSGDGTRSVTFSASSVRRLNGEESGEAAYAESANGLPVLSITCASPAYARTVSVNRGSGAATAALTLDPSSPDCFSWGVSAPSALQVSGSADGTFRESTNGISVSTQGTGASATRLHRNSSEDCFGEVFSESVNYSSAEG